LPKSQSEALADLSTEEQRKEELKKLDTDKDGLTDYDETYIYNTSPFIEDSDSDGLPDKAEVLAGEDPNCPKGRICFAPQAATSTPEAASAPIDSELPLPSLDKFTGVLAPVAAGDLRKQLEASGLSKSMLDSLTDKELQELYVETLREVLATSTR